MAYQRPPRAFLAAVRIPTDRPLPGIPRDPAKALQKFLDAHERPRLRVVRVKHHPQSIEYIFRETHECGVFRSSTWHGLTAAWCADPPSSSRPMSREEQRDAAALIRRMRDPSDPTPFPKETIEMNGNSRSKSTSRPRSNPDRRYLTVKLEKSGNSRSFRASKGPQKRTGYVVASVIVSDQHPIVRRYGLRGARVIAKRLGFRSFPVERTGTSYRFPQVPAAAIRAGSWRTFKIPGRAHHVALLYGRVAHVRDNPVPAAWKVLPPNSRYECAPYERDLLGREIPGRGGGTVTGCATPDARFYVQTPTGWSLRKGAQGQVVIGEGKAARTMRKTVARHRLRPRPEYVTGFEPGEIEQYIHYRQSALDADELWEPGPPGVEFRHPRGSSRCMPDHPIWSAKDEAKEEVARSLEHVSERVAGPSTMLALLREHPKYDEWAATEAACVDAYERRKRTRAGHAGYSDVREAAERRRRAKHHGLDVHGAEYLDQLTPQGRASYYRRLHKRTGSEFYLQQARALERDIRARQGARDKAKRRKKRRR